MGFDEPCFRESVDSMIDTALNSPSPWLKGIDRARLERERHVRLNFAGEESAVRSQESEKQGAELRSLGQPGPAVPTQTWFLPFADGNFATPSGKAELYCEHLKAEGLDPVVQFVPPQESRHSQKGQFPLEMLARKADNFLNSTFTNLPSVQELEQAGLLEISARDAGARGISNGDRVRVFNSRGEIELTACVDGRVQSGMVSAKLHWAKLTAGGKNINVLTSEKLTDMGNSATFYSVLVEVERIQPAS
jgi:anaerobic selenocysteine-containing dehydrogenase